MRSSPRIDGLRAILAAGASAHARTLSWERCAAATYGLAYAGEPASAARAMGWHEAADRGRVLLALATGAARAESENCRKSREYLLGTPGGDLALTPQAYNDLFKICIAPPPWPTSRMRTC